MIMFMFVPKRSQMIIFMFVAGSIIGAILLILIGEQAIGKEPEINDSRMTYKVGEYADLDWFMAKWDAAGWKTPRDGERVTWKDYLAPQPYGQEGDMVCYHEDGKKQFALVAVIDKGEKDGKPGVMATYPLSRGLIRIFFIPQEDVDGFLRPIHKKDGTQAFGFPTHPPTGEVAA